MLSREKDQKPGTKWWIGIEQNLTTKNCLEIYNWNVYCDFEIQNGVNFSFARINKKSLSKVKLMRFC